MATLLLGAVGGAIGSSIGGAILGVSAAAIGQAVGATIGRSIDQRLLGGLSPVKQEGPRLDNLDVMTSQEGAPLPEINGRVGLSGEVIWAAKLKEKKRTKTTSVGSGKQSQKVERTTYSYFASFAISLGEGPLAHYGRVWANGKLLDLSEMVDEGRVRFYHGTETQQPDPLIDAIEGGAPAYRGTAYVVFEELPLKDFGNQVPQIKIEVFGRSGEMESLVKGVNVIPGSTEWGYMPSVVEKQTFGAAFGEIGDSFYRPAEVVSEQSDNATRYSKVSDWQVSLDQLGAILPEAETVSLVVAWFGTDLRAGLCEVEPRIELRDKKTDVAWRAAGLTRETANLVSTGPNGRPAYGSAPADISVIEAIKDLRARGKRVVLYPFVMMDLTADQALPNPSGPGTQGAYPWRGRIMPRASENASAEVSAFMGAAVPADFSVSGESVSYSGPAEWRFRRFILHLAHLAQAAGGVDAMLIGSELRGLTMSPDAPGAYPFVNALRTLAADVRSVLPGALISYAADWSEYHSHQDGGDLRFHLDPLWADPNIDFVGIDNYLPLSDWRAGTEHADYDPAKGHTTPYALDYLKSNIEGGEYWDWYYASEADRVAQVRTPISDGAYGEPWVYRQKAIRDWRANAHHERVGGARQASPTAWVAASKPVWFTELGCPAVDNGANQPNVFFAANSSEGALPWFSNGFRDDFMQRQFLRASLEWWRDNGGDALSVDNVQVWCWDARPFPEFPLQTGIWADGNDWFLGHWLNGRAGTAPAAEALARRLTERHGLTPADFDLTACYGQADGYPAAAPIGFRNFLQPLEIGLALQAHERDGKLVVESRSTAITAPEATEPVMVDDESGALFAAKRGAIEDVAATAVVRFIDGLGSYEKSSTRALIGAGRAEATATAESPLVLDFDRGTATAERLLRTAADGREEIAFRLPRSATHVRPGVIIPVRIGTAPARPMMVERVVEGIDKRIEARSFNLGGYAPTGGVFRPVSTLATRGSSVVLARLLDLPILPGSTAADWDTLAAFHADPWPAGVVWEKSPDSESGFVEAGASSLPSSIGRTMTDLPAGQVYTWNDSSLSVQMYSGTLVGRPEVDVLNGANALAIKHPDGWEIIQFQEAQLIGTGEWRLSRLLRGRLGTDCVVGVDPMTAGASVVLLDETLAPLGVGAAEVGLPRYYRFYPEGGGASAKVAQTATVRPHTCEGVGWRPYAPCHLRATQSGGDTSCTWIRRTRVDGEADWRDGVGVVPLGERAERYAVEVISGSTIRHSAEVTAPAFTYTAAQASADGVSAPFNMHVAQISESYGPGAWASVEVAPS